MIRVVHLSVVHHPGDIRIFERECRTLAAAGYDVTFLVPGAPPMEPGENPRQLALPVRGRSRRWMSVREIVEELRRLRPHILHIHDPELLTIVPFARARVPRVVYDMHEYVPEAVATKSYIPARARPAAARVTAVAQRTLAMACNGVVSAAPGQLAALGRRPALRVAMVNYPRYANFAAATPRPEILADDRLKLIHVGALGRNRGLFLMLDVMAALGPDAPVSLYLAGRYADPDDEPVVRERAERELEGRVHLIGQVPPAEVPDYLTAADVCWSPFVGGPQYSLPNVPTKVYEGMAAGLPVLVSDLADHAAPVKRERCGVWVPVSVEGHVAGVRRLMDDRTGRKAMGERGRAAVRDRYSWEAIEGDLLAFYAELCKGLPAA